MTASGTTDTREPLHAAFALFDTAIGTCAIVWSATGIVGVALPDATPEHTRDDVRRRFPAAAEHPVPPAIAPIVGALTAHTAGTTDDLRWVPVDYRDISEFDCSVYEFTRSLDPGSTATYGDVAAALGRPGGAQAVGQALGRNPVPLVVPCHRVLAAGGAIGGFSAPGAVVTKRELLALEHTPGFDDPTLF
ncbi:MAG: methylated-DNA--[protein]-cysteine S-methyltransferase [Rhodococcus sp. (in: high G+C Gram-positive bacteria)]